MFDNSDEVKKWVAAKGDSTLRVEYPLDESSVVFDVGAYKGKWGEKIHEKYGSTIHFFEPVERHVKELLKKFTGDKFIVNCFGLGGWSRTADISLIGKDLDGSTILNNKYEKTLCIEEIKIVDIKEYIRSNNVEEIDLLKLNVEGLEFEIIESLIDSGLINIVKDLQIQFHNFIEGSENRRSNIREYLKNKFRLTYDFPFVWENWRRI